MQNVVQTEYLFVQQEMQVQLLYQHLLKVKHL